jgi:hypothetical protein
MKLSRQKSKIGDYTRERRQHLRDISVSTVTTRIRARKKTRA